MTRRRVLLAAGLALSPPWLLAQVSGDAAPRRARARAPADDAVAALRLTALDGREHRLVDDTPRYRIVNLWARWCAPCRRELPSLQRLAAQLDPRSHALLTIALDDDAFALREYARDLGLTLPIVPLASSALPPRWRARTLPQTLALAPDGALVGRVAGAREWDRPDALAELLGAPRRRSS